MDAANEGDLNGRVDFSGPEEPVPREPRRAAR